MLVTLLVAIMFPYGRSGAQEVQFARQRGPYYVGEPVVVEVQVAGLKPGPEPSCRLTNSVPDGVTIQGPDVGQSSRSFTQIINGQVTSSESTDYRFRFLVTASREGKFEIGPFELTYQGVSKTVAGETFEFGKLESDPNMQIEMFIKQDSIYVGQEVPLTIRWSFIGELPEVQYAFSNLQIRSPLFDQFRFKDEPGRARTPLTIATANGIVNVEGEVTQEKRDGRDCVVVTGSRILVADTPGDYQQIPVTCRTKKVTRWGRDLFGDAVARASAPALSAGSPLSLVIKPVPIKDRPSSYSGAVGNGFSLDVSASSSVVRVGDPIALTITVRGDGNLESISLPDLAANEGLTTDRFQIPSEAVAGTLEGNSKQFAVNVRVKDPSVAQIPPVAFSWFDPIQEKFVTTRSKPIALQVMETQVISAKDVVTAHPGLRSAENDGGMPTSLAAGGTTATPPGLSFVGANLAIERDLARLSRNHTLGTSPRTIAVTVYSAAVLIVAGGLFVRRRSRMDSVAVQRKKRLRSLRRRIESAKNLPPREAAQQVAQTLRELVATFEPHERAEIDRLIAICDTTIYAIDDSGSADLVNIIERSATVLDDVARPLTLMTEGRGVRG